MEPERNERYKVEFRAGWLYRLKVQDYDIDNDKCVYTYKFEPYAPGMNEGLKLK
jgi:hypothetical protein